MINQPSDLNLASPSGSTEAAGQPEYQLSYKNIPANQNQNSFALHNPSIIYEESTSMFVPHDESEDKN